MRGLAFLGLGFGLILAWSVFAGLVPLRAAPDIVLLVALYLGLSHESTFIGALALSVTLGYLADVVGGAPHGLYESAAVVTCLFGHALSGRFVVRGVLVEAAAGMLASLIGGAVVMVAQVEALRAHRAGPVLLTWLVEVLLTALVAPPCFALFHWIDHKREQRRLARRAFGAFS